jgi:hypothetical protein
MMWAAVGHCHVDILHHSAALTVEHALQDFITITLGCQIPWNVHQRCLSSMRYCSPHHYTPTSESVDFLNTVISVTAYVKPE